MQGVGPLPQILHQQLHPGLAAVSLQGRPALGVPAGGGEGGAALLLGDGEGVSEGGLKVWHLLDDHLDRGGLLFQGGNKFFRCHGLSPLV